MKAAFIIGLILCSVASNSQTSEEWLEQKKTQRKYLLEQIAALNVHLEHVKKGYDIVRNGLTAIHNIKNGDLNLHSEYFNSLQQVNPAIRNYVKVAGVISYGLQIMKKAKQTISRARETALVTPVELDYCKRVFDHLHRETLANLEELMALTTSGAFEMRDNERIKRIDALYIDMQDKNVFCSSFSSEVTLLAVQRGHESDNVKHSKILNAVK